MGGGQSCHFIELQFGDQPLPQETAYHNTRPKHYLCRTPSQFSLRPRPEALGRRSPAGLRRGWTGCRGAAGTGPSPSPWASHGCWTASWWPGPGAGHGVQRTLCLHISRGQHLGHYFGSISPGITGSSAHILNYGEILQSRPPPVTRMHKCL